MDCTHPSYVVHEEQAPGGVYMVTVCSVCGAELGRYFMAD